MDDRALVVAMVGGDPRGLDGAYRRYADRLHAYCRGVLRSADAAADVVHDTFLIASQRAGDLREPDRLQSWLYTIARRECLRVLRAGQRAAPLDNAVEPAADPVDPTRAVHAAQLRELVRSATAGLSERDREMIELSVRHELSPADVGTILGLSANHAHARMSRARSQLHRSLGALLVARAGGTRCGALTELTRGWGGVFTPLLRKRVTRHIERCAKCSEHQRELLNPAQLLPAYGALPFLPVPAVVWERLEAGRSSAAGGGPPNPSDPSPGSPHSEPSPADLPPNSTAQAPPPSPPSPPPPPPYASPPTLPMPTPMAHGPRPPASRGDGRLRVVAAAALFAILVLAAGTAVLWRLDLLRPAAQNAGPLPAPEQLTPVAEPTTPAPAATETALDDPPPPATTSAPVILTLLPFTVTADDEPACVASQTFRITVTVQSTVQLDQVLLYWRAPATARDEMTLTGPRTAEGTTLVLTGSFAQWWVEADATDGRAAETAPITVINPC